MVSCHSGFVGFAVLHQVAHLGGPSLTHSLLYSIVLLGVCRWLLGLSRPPTLLSSPLSHPSVFVLSGDLVPSHQSIRFIPAPPDSFCRCFHLIISLKKKRKKKGFFSGQLEVTDHIRAAFRLSDHLIKPRSISPPLFVDHLFFLRLRGEASGPRPNESHSYPSFRGAMGDLHQFPGIWSLTECPV